MSAMTAETRIATSGSSSFVVRAGVAEGLRSAPSFLFPPDDPLAAGRRYHVSDPALAYGAGIAESGACDLSVATMPHSEFLTIWTGTIALHQADGTVARLGPGDSAVVPAGAKLRWVQTGRVVRSFVVFSDEADDGSTAVVTIDPSGPLGALPGSASNAYLTPAPATENRRDFVARGGKVRAGVWQGSPYARRQVTPAHAELMFILAGKVEITETTGAEWPLKPGEAILIPAGATNAWTSAETVRKVFCLVS